MTDSSAVALAATPEPKRTQKGKPKKVTKNAKPSGPTRRDQRRAEEVATSKSLVPAKYRERYGRAAHCGDDMALRLKKHLAGKDGKLDVAKMAKLAKANGLAGWGHLNVGQQRMLLGLKLRSIAAKGGKVVWG